MKPTKIEFSRQGNFILTLLLIYFAFYGYLSIVYEKSIGEGVMFLYQVMFIPGGPSGPLIMYMFFPESGYSMPLLSALTVIEQLTFLIIYIIILILPFVGKFILKWSTKNSLLALLITQVVFMFFFLGPKPLVIYFTIVFILVFRERFFEYGIRNSIWIIPFIIGMSWMWYFLMNPGLNFFVVMGVYFLRIEAYITIFMLVGINLITAILASTAKEKYIQYYEKRKKIEV